MTKHQMKGSTEMVLPNAEAYALGLVFDDNLWLNPKTNTLYYSRGFACGRFVERNARVDKIRIDIMDPYRYQRVFFEYVDEVRGSYEDCVFSSYLAGNPGISITVKRVKAWIHSVRKFLGEEDPCKTDCLLCVQPSDPLSSSSQTVKKALNYTHFFILIGCVFVLHLFIIYSVVRWNSESIAEELRLELDQRLQLIEESLVTSSIN